jgi:hypothetical protein
MTPLAAATTSSSPHATDENKADVGSNRPPIARALIALLILVDIAWIGLIVRLAALILL